MEDENVVPVAAGRKKPFILFRAIQWAMVGVGLLALLILHSAFKHLSVPNAPIALFWLAVAAIVGLAALHSPPIFFRLPGKGKAVAYAGLLPGLIFLGTALGQVRDAYDQTPERRAQLAREDQELAAMFERIGAEKQADEKSTEQILAEDAAARREAMKRKCPSLVADVIALARKKHGLEIIEINNIEDDAGAGDLTAIGCKGIATTDRGSGAIRFSQTTSPQGRILLNLSFPYGIE